jgi:hypothetical protein
LRGVTYAKAKTCPVHESVLFTRSGFDELIALGRDSLAYELRIDDVSSIHVDKFNPLMPCVLFVCRLKPRGAPADIERDYRRVWICDVDGVLRTTALTEEDCKFAEHVYERCMSVLDQKRRQMSSTLS